PHRAVLRGGAADGHDDVEHLVEELRRPLRLRAADVDAGVGHGPDGHRMNPPGRPRARRYGLDDVAVKRVRDPLGHLAPRGVSGAAEEDALLDAVFHGASRSMTQSLASRR